MQLGRYIAGIVNVAVVVTQVACTEPESMPAPLPGATASGAGDFHRDRSPTARFAREASGQYLPALPLDALSAQEREISRVAEQNGDRDFLMIDKPLGKLILFEDAKPVYIGAALTGESSADRLPADALSETETKRVPVAEKVTPAGRFTVTPGYDKNYGPVFDINEVRGAHWVISIHQVYLGIPSEHRAERLRSPTAADNFITNGCINVAADTMRLLTRELPADGPTAIYVLPRDPTNLTMYFAPPAS